LNSIFLKFTPVEFQVANFVKNGKTTKEMAKLLGVATSTIDTYRDSIRKKLGIKNRKINLKTYLVNIKQYGSLFHILPMIIPYCLFICFFIYR